MARTLQDIIASVPAAVRWKLDREIDFEHRDIRGRVVPQDLGRIAESMVDWDGAVADCLGLTETERSDIRESSSKPKLQRREVLNKWKSKFGKEATYRALIEVFFKAGKVDYADAVCYLFQDTSASDLGMDSNTPTTASHAQTTNAPTNATAVHIGFSPSMGPDSLAQWLRQEYGSDYHEDVEKLCKAKINGKQLLNNISTMISRLDLSFGFQMEIEERTKQLKEPGGAMLPSNSAASLPPAHTSTPSTQIRPNGNTSCTILGLPSQPKLPQQARNLNQIVSDDGGASQGQRLTLRHLSSLKTKSSEKINIIQQVAPHWQDFAMNLDFDPNGTTMQTTDRKHHSDPEACCRETMQLWLNGRGRQPATFELLVELLRDCNLIVLAQQVEEAIPYNQ